MVFFLQLIVKSIDRAARSEKWSLKLDFFQLWRFQKQVQLHVSLWENDPTSHLIIHLCKQFPCEFMVSLSSVRSSLIQHDGHFINHGHQLASVSLVISERQVLAGYRWCFTWLRHTKASSHRLWIRVCICEWIKGPCVLKSIIPLFSWSHAQADLCAYTFMGWNVSVQSWKEDRQEP